MTQDHTKKIAAELKVALKQVEATVGLLDNGATVPFISRYRKEVTGSLDEVAVTAVRDRIHQLRELDKRRATVIETIQAQGKLTDELKKQILAAECMSVLEDIYLPFKPKRRTRATMAKEKGLEPLARLIFEQGEMDLEKEAAKYINKGREGEPLKEEAPARKAEEKNQQTAASVEEALSGARDIIAEWVNEDKEARERIRKLFFEKGRFKARVISGRQEQGQNYRDYFNWEEDVGKIPSHRVLAVRRGEKEEILTLKVMVPQEEALKILEGQFVKAQGPASEQVRLAVHDSYKRLLSLSMETEIRVATKEEADRKAVEVFVKNLRQLLMAPPLGQHSVLAIDPGFRTGCKVACLSAEGQFLENDTIYPEEAGQRREEGIRIITGMCKRHKIEFIAIGNGTASRETETFIRSIGLPKDIPVLIVSESGASIYSASKVAREEFPDQDVTVRGAISIGRRLMDPLAELVKIDPKSIGVGQYQHDVDQGLLKQSLDDVVVSCVNSVGVELNTASKQLLAYVSGLGPARAERVVEYRNAHRPFRSLEELYEVPRLGAKAIEQAAGFLRIRDGENPLDASAVHPESYQIVAAMARDLECRAVSLMRDEDLRKQIDLNKYVTDKTGLPTLTDIYNELARPGRDPREEFEMMQFKEGVTRLQDLKTGMKLPGIVTNITNFGVFVDVGVHLDGLIHISQLSDSYIKDPNEVVKVHQNVQVTVLAVDLERKRIALSMKSHTGLEIVDGKG